MPRNKYQTHVEPYIELITSWREKGLTYEQIAEKLKIANSTLRKHADENPALSVALRASKEKLVANLKKSLWQEALGYEYEEIQETAEIVGNSDDKKVKPKPKKMRRTKTTKKMRGIPNLLIFALCNLAPDEFMRVDKEVDDKLNEALDEIKDLKERYSNDLIKQAFDVLYPNVAKKIEKEKAKDEKD